MTYKEIPAVSGTSAEEILSKHPGSIAVLFHGRRLVGQSPTNLMKADKAYVIFPGKEELRGMKPELTKAEIDARTKRFEEVVVSEVPNFKQIKRDLERDLPMGLDDVILAAFFKELGKTHGNRTTEITKAAREYFEKCKRNY